MSKLNRPKHFCYLPTRKLCELDDKLDDLFFPENYQDVIRQEIVTYYRHPDGVKRAIFTRTFSGEGKHTDSSSSDFLLTKEN